MDSRIYEYIKNYIDNKKILIYGMGQEGKSTLAFFIKYFPNSDISILDEQFSIPDELTKNIKLVKKIEEINNFDLIFKSPGIVIDDKILIDKSKLTSQTELFIQCFRNQIIGITGTKGKSTTSSLLYYILKQYNTNTILVGNIGIPCLDLIEQINENTIIIFELSCHQLEYVKVSPHIGIILNLFPEHLDHYKSFEKYAQAKKNIFRYQQENDIVIINENYKHLLSYENNFITVSNSIQDSDISVLGRKITIPQNEITIQKEDTQLLGKHNLYNISIVYYICNQYFNLSNEEFKYALKTFKGLPHRLEFIGEYNQIKYYDDSISTICETTIEALKCLENVGTLLLGGMDRGIDYSKLVDFIVNSNVDNIILLPDTSKRLDYLFKRISNHNKNIILTENLEKAVDISKQITPKGKICLLSPAAASYGFFKNFEERGNKFLEYVKKQNSN